MIQKVKTYINKSEFVKNSLTLFTGTSIAQLIPLIFSPVLSRLYSPADFGVLALYMSIASILAVFATGRYEMAIVLPKKDSDAINIFSLSVIISIGLGLLITAAVFLFNSQITEFSGNKNISFYLYFLPLTVFSLGLFKSLNYWFNRRNQFKNIAKSKVIASSGNSAVAISTGFLKKGSFGLVFGWIAGQLSSALYLLGVLILKEKEHFKSITKAKIIEVFKRYKKFPLFDTWSELLNVLSVQFPIIILTQYYGEEITGHYSFAYKILLVPFSLLAFSMGQAFFKRANELKNSGKDVSAFTFGVFKKLVLISFVPLAVTGIFGDYIFPFIFGNEWTVAGEYSRIFSLWIFIIFISSPLTNLFAVYERQRTNLIFNFVMFVSRIGLLIFMSEKGYDDYTSIFVYVVSGFVFRFLYLVVIMKIANISFFKVLVEILKYTVPVFILLMFIRLFIIRT